MRVGLVAAGIFPLLLVAGCADNAPREPAAAAKASTAAETSPLAGVTPVPRHEQKCKAGDLAVSFAPTREGAGGHLLSLLEFRNVGISSCQLSGYPRGVMLTEPGRRPVRATNGSFFPVATSRPMEAGEVTTLGVETDTSCTARPTGGPSGPMYHEVRVLLSGGVIRVATPAGRALDVGCGVHLTKFTAWQ